MPLLTGTWTIVADGHEGTLHINSVAPTGEVNFALVIPGFAGTGGNDFNSGYWDESSQTITLHITKYDLGPIDPGPGIPNFYASFAFEGCQFPMPAQPLPGQDVVWTLVGHFNMIGSGPGGPTPSARRHRFGWRATLNQTL